MSQWLADHWPESLATAMVAAFGWIAKRVLGFSGRISKLDKRVTALESQLITHDNLDELRRSMNATFVNGHERIEKRMDELLMLMVKK